MNWVRYSLLDHHLGAGRAPASTSPSSSSQWASRLPPSWSCGRVGIERALGIVDDRQRLVVDLDRVDGGERRVLALGGDERDRLAVVADDLVGQHVRARLERPDLERLARDVDPDRVAGHVGGGVDGDHAVESPRRRRCRPG